MDERKERQRRVMLWATECFGAAEANDPVQRGLRFAEEAIELAQTVGCDARQLHELVDYIYARKPGEIANEIGGVSLTLLALAQATDQDADKCERDELRRVLSKAPHFFAERNARKNAMGFKNANLG